MLKGKSLTEMAQALEDIRQNARDFIVPVEKMKMETIKEVVEVPSSSKKQPELVTKERNVLTFPNGGGEKHEVKPNGWAGRQIAAHCDIPGAYYDRIAKENPKLLAENVNHGLHYIPSEEEGKRPTRMMRTYKGQLRAFLSSKYRRLDSVDLLETVLPVLIENKFQVESSELTERRTYIKAVTPRIQTEVKKGDVVQFGLTISSSDVGAGALRVEPLIYRLVCLNGMIGAHAIKKFHIGKDQADGQVYEILQDETKDLTDKAFWMQVRDVILAAMRPENFEREVEKLKRAAGLPINNFDIPEVVELTNKAINGGASKLLQGEIVKYLANGADGAGMNQWGLINGFTWAAQQEGVDYDTSVELERAASKILDLTPKQWAQVAGGSK